MRRTLSTLAATVLAVLPSLALAQTTAPAMPGKVQTTPIPDEFRDPETHLRVVHLSRFPNDYSGVVYFTYNPFSADSRQALIDAQFKDKWRHLYTFDFSSMTVTPLVTDRLTQNQVVVAKSGNVYYEADHGIWVIPLKGSGIDSRNGPEGASQNRSLTPSGPRKICDLPARWRPGTGFTVNADETLLLGGSADEPGSKTNILFTANLKTGELKVIHRDDKWFGHAQFSPTDPDLCMFCWEGNWERVDRIWFINPSRSTIDASDQVTSNARIAYHRTETGEIAGHEFWHPDGKTIWFQQAFRKSKREGGLVCMDVATGKTTQYKIPAGYGGIHESWSPDGTFMIADGGAPKGNTKPGPGKYISKLMLPTDGSNVLVGEHLVTLHANDYAVEPNPHVSPDNHWVIFTATLHGTAQAYAVELPKEK